MMTITSPAMLEQFRIAYDLSSNWHEPDARDITARIDGRLFDNAHGQFQADSPAPEMTVILSRNGEDIAAVNLANLMAWASRSGRPGHDNPRQMPQPQFRQIVMAVPHEASHSAAHRRLIHLHGHEEAPARYTIGGYADTAAQAEDLARDKLLEGSHRDGLLFAIGFRDGGEHVVGWVFAGYERVYEPRSTRMERYDLLTVAGNEPGFQQEDAGRLALRYNGQFDRWVIDDWQACLIVKGRCGAGGVFLTQEPDDQQKIGRFHPKHSRF